MNAAAVLKQRSDPDDRAELRFPTCFLTENASDAVEAIRAQRKKWDRDIARKQNAEHWQQQSGKLPLSL